MRKEVHNEIQWDLPNTDRIRSSKYFGDYQICWLKSATGKVVLKKSSGAKLA